jgi:hypothetical protein
VRYSRQLRPANRPRVAIHTRRLAVERFERRDMLHGGDTLSPSAMPDFDLADLNPSSSRYGEVVSPRDYLQQVSGWYFTHST